MEFVAHSPRVKRNIPRQSYCDHITAVRRSAQVKMSVALQYHKAQDARFLAAVDWAAAYHDLGKLESDNQKVLQTSETAPLPINHVDAGVAHVRSVGQVEAALAIYSHHIGLCDLPEEIAKDQRNRQDAAQSGFRDPLIKLATDKSLPELLARHGSIGLAEPTASACFDRQLTGFQRRLLLSCIVDADHHDTAKHYRREGDLDACECRWEERQRALDVYVQELAREPGARTSLRMRIYEACLTASPHERIWACDSPVGSGKTTAIMAYLLHAAKALKLRHVIVVLPYTNIVEQAVKIYRAALVLAGEDPEKVVVAHHHQSEFGSVDIRYLTTLWDAPIIVTTAVQFFETLGSNQTARLRKLNQLPGSAVFVDEAHAAMPVHLWPFMWRQLEELAEEWACRFVLGSGSLIKFWENPRILGEKNTTSLPSMIPEDLRLLSSDFERRRVRYDTRTEPVTLATLCDWIQEFSGPRLIIMNTVQSAAVVARELGRRGIFTKHLSTALAPVHRRKILKEIEGLLLEKPGLDWILVATSCVEAGVELSFALAFRERCRATSIVQIGGRVNRHGERGQGVVWDFVVNDPLLPPHPDFQHSSEVVEDLFRKRMWGEQLTTLMTYALEQEFKRSSRERNIKQLLDCEKIGSYPAVAKLSRLITADTRIVVIDQELIANLRHRVSVERRELLDNSVQLWATKIQSLCLNPIADDLDLYAWEYSYDPDMLGIMDGILKQIDINEVGCAIV